VEVKVNLNMHVSVSTCHTKAMSTERPEGFAVYPRGYGPLFDRAARLFQADPRARGMWLHGALARGAADAGSDLDIDVAVADETFDEFAASWRDWLAEITPTVSALPVPGLPGSFYALTPNLRTPRRHM
jgi:predicted nucleotidyltransferase